MGMVLKPQDIVILLKLAVHPKNIDWSYNQLAYELQMSPSEAHAGIKRSTQARLFDPNRKKPITKALVEFLVHGVKYAFPPDYGPMTRGIPTAHAVPILSKHFVNPDNEIFVWPHPKGTHRGLELSPLFRSVPDIVHNDNRLYEALAVLDVLRVGRAREQKRAQFLLATFLHKNEKKASGR